MDKSDRAIPIETILNGEAADEAARRILARCAAEGVREVIVDITTQGRRLYGILENNDRIKVIAAYRMTGAGLMCRTRYTRDI